MVYVGGDDGKLHAYPALPQGCAGAPGQCLPAWTGATAARVFSSPAVANKVVYVGSDDHELYAFDALGGDASCSGVPRTCTALWTATTGGTIDSSPAVTGGVVYVGSSDGNLYAFDAAGNMNCSGAPKTCAPLWTAAPDVGARRENTRRR
jgi:outer membrane protein assembly factor BamB